MNPEPAAAEGTETTASATNSSAPGGGVIADERMRELLEVGQATHLAAHVTDYVSYQDCWWTGSGETWLPVTDHELHALLDRYQRRMQRGLFG